VQIQKKIEAQRHLNTVGEVLKDKVEELKQALIEDEEASRFLQDWNEKRQATLRKHNRSARMLVRLRELLNCLRQGVGEDEFNYKEVISILKDTWI